MALTAGLVIALTMQNLNFRANSSPADLQNNGNQKKSKRL
jgi:hypothetical protein